MLYIKTFENFNTDIIEKLKLFDWDIPFEEFERQTMALSDIDKQKILDFTKEFNNSGLILYHGTPKFRQIDDEGLKLTRGERTSGFMGAPYYVNNLGVFLSDKERTAKFFGDNRADYKQYKVLAYIADIHNILDFTTKIPYKFNKLGSELINNYYGGKRTKIARSDIFWCLDIPKFVDLIKSEGYDAVKFLEDPENKKGQKTSCTYFIMDVNKLHRKILTMRDLYNYVRKLVNHSSSKLSDAPSKS